MNPAPLRKVNEVLRVLLGLAVFAFTVYAVVECIQTEDEQVRNLPKLAWVLIILLFMPIGGIAWVLAGRTQGLTPPSTWGWQQRPQGPRGPDDDPDFLRKL